MGFKMKELDQQLIKFEHKENFEYEDFYVSSSNKHIFNYSTSGPNGKKFLNINGEQIFWKNSFNKYFLKEI